MIYAIFQLSDAFVVGRVKGACNLQHDNIVAGPFLNGEAAQTALKAILRGAA